MFQARMIHGQPVFCSDPDPTQSGSLYNWAVEQGVDLDFLDGVFDNCISNPDGYSPNYFELELRRFDKVSRTWNGPYLYWSKARDSGQNYGNMNAVFWDELNLSKIEKDQTCYLDMCDPHPCHPDSGCIN